jgi:O-antigen chain-terminating methyltransferase
MFLVSSEQIAAVVEEIRQRVRARYEKQVEGLPDFCLPSLVPLAQARDAAEGKVAAIGTVNPRGPGLMNGLIQGVKKLAARALRWHVREQVEFNRAVLTYLDRLVVVLDEQNRQMLVLARFIREHTEAVRTFEEWRSGWLQWRAGWEERWTRSEIQMLRSVAELQAAFQHRVDVLDAGFRENLRAQHSDYLGALDRYSLGIQKRLWDDLAKVRLEYERSIHTELRLIRQRSQSPIPLPQHPTPDTVHPPLDYGRFAERFRGTSEYVAESVKFYLPYFVGRQNVVDLGCGRGEFLELMQKHNVPARGVDSDAESIALCRQKGLAADQADLFAWLADVPDATLDGVFCSQVVEHLPPQRVPEMVALAARKLHASGLLVIETPNPECLAIFATHFYLDPTHTRPVPSALLHFYFEESGLGGIEVHQRSPAVESFAELGDMPEPLRRRFFGGLDYAIVGRRL